MSVERHYEEQIDERQLLAVRKACTADDLLYGIFTSGSTGVPKGIVVSHKSVINFITHFIHTFQFAETDVIGNQAPFDFDVSVKDIYTCLMTGATLVIIPTKLFSVPPVLLDYLCNKHVNTLIWAVSALTLISALHGLKYRIPIEVKRVMFSGEVMPVKQLRQWQLALPEAEFVNLYGPSEITCNCTYYRVKEYLKMMRFCRLGKPLTEEKYFLWMMKEKRFQRQKKAVKSVCQVSRSQKNIIIIRRKQEKIPVDGNCRRHGAVLLYRRSGILQCGR